MRAALVACVLVGCASGRTAGEAPDASVGGGPDAKVWRDGSIEATPDAHTVVVPPDAYQCQVQQQQLLQNPVLDLNPSGMGWVQLNIDNLAPIVTGDDGVPEHSPPFKAWMGGLEGVDYGYYSITDVLYQDITIPAGATALRLTGQWDMLTTETELGVYDDAQIALVQQDGTPIETVLSMTNDTLTIGWNAIDHAFAAPHAGETVRLRLMSTNDVVNATSFFFDTLALTATVCQ
jgi:hypothetical protein